jgi:YfiH family protein
MTVVACLEPDWPAPTGVRALITTRAGGVSVAPYSSFNLGLHVGDREAAVGENRARLRAVLPAEPVWLEQVHGTAVVDAASMTRSGPVPRADGAFSRERDVVCAIMMADCLPVLLAGMDGAVVGVAHAGWRGLSAGVIESTIDRMGEDPARIVAYLGPAIGPAAYEVGAEVRDAFVSHSGDAARAFVDRGGGKFLCDLYRLARQRLGSLGVLSVHGGDACTFADRERFFSFRRDGRTGRMAALVWRT